MNEQLHPGEVIKPYIDKETATNLVHKLYGLKVKLLNEMNSYDDRNFKITVEDVYENNYINNLCMYGYTLKIVNKLDSKNTYFIDAMNNVLYKAYEQGLQVPIPVKNKLGNTWSVETLPDEQNQLNEYVVRLLTFLPGTTIYNISYTSSILYQWGQLLAYFHQALKNFSNDAISKRTTLWSLYSIPRILDFVFVIENDKRQKLVTEIVNTFAEDVLKENKILCTGIVHGDFNEHNILVKESDKGYEVYGILDLGDMHVAPIVFDVAIMLTYTMLECKTMDPLKACGHAIAGYLSVSPLSEDEYQILKVCISARLCQSLVLGAYTHSLDPSNFYVLSTSRTGWEILQKLWNTSHEELESIWKNIINSYNVDK